MKIALSGARGLVGSGLVRHLRQEGMEIYPLVRRRAAGESAEIFWDPVAGEIEADRLEGMDAVIHLAGENLAGLWTAGKKRRIITSRVEGTRLLSEALAGLKNPPRLLLCASAVGFYGSRGDAVVDEDTPQGQGFLADLCRAWEAAADPARMAGIRVVHSRFGLILDPAGGALGPLLPLLRLGLGGPLGSGRQYWSWVAMQDVHRALAFILRQETLAGAVNITAPAPVTNREFIRAAARQLHRPAFVPAPAFALRLLLGQMADEMLLSSARVAPKKLLEAGFSFTYPELTSALAAILG